MHRRIDEKQCIFWHHDVSFGAPTSATQPPNFLKVGASGRSLGCRRATTELHQPRWPGHRLRTGTHQPGLIAWSVPQWAGWEFAERFHASGKFLKIEMERDKSNLSVALGFCRETAVTSHHSLVKWSGWHLVGISSFLLPKFRNLHRLVNISNAFKCTFQRSCSASPFLYLIFGIFPKWWRSFSESSKVG